MLGVNLGTARIVPADRPQPLAAGARIHWVLVRELNVARGRQEFGGDS
jgi:hypothetical protein